MAGVMIPVIVHLWNDRKGKVLRIGSVALLTGASQRATWSSRLTQIFLLVLRCLLVMVLAILLARPYWLRPASAERKGWVLAAADGGGPFALRIDSLVKAGYERKLLDSVMGYWGAFRQADSMAPAGVPFFVFTPGLANRFTGMRPVTHRPVHWEVYAPVDSARQWIAAAWRVSADSIMVLRGTSGSTGTQFHRDRVESRADEYEGVTVDTASPAVGVHGDAAHTDDERYVVAALKALGELAGRRVRINADGSKGNWWRHGGDWDEAAWSGRLPFLLREQVLPEVKAGDNDRRLLDPGQAAPLDAGVRVGVGEEPERVDLRPVVWGVLFLLFVFERIKSLQDGRRKA